MGGSAGIGIPLLLIVGALVPALLVGILLLFLGLRGRVVARGSFCRRCGFSLEGLRVAATDASREPAARASAGDDPARSTRGGSASHSQASGARPPASQCPECGADLNRPSAIRPLRRRKRPVMLAIAVLFLLISLAGVGSIVASRRPNIISALPTWYLSLEARGAQGPGASRAIDELTRRLSAGSLSNKTTSSLVARALKFQSDANGPWLPAWATSFSPPGREAWSARSSTWNTHGMGSTSRSKRATRAAKVRTPSSV